MTACCQPFLEVKTRATLLANFSKTAEQKPFDKFVALLAIRIILKNEHNQRALEEVIAKNRYPTK